MKTLPALLLLCLVNCCFAQQISQSTNASASGYAQNTEGFSVDWTMATPFTTVVLSDDHHLTEGFQQGNIIAATLADSATVRQSEQGTISESLLLSAINFELFPNPTSDQLFLRLDASTPESLEIRVIQSTGKQVLSQSAHCLPGQKLKINGIEYLPPGTYFVHIDHPSEKISPLHFVKF